MLVLRLRHHVQSILDKSALNSFLPAANMQTTSEQQRPITSCFSCRRRKVRCDHGYPVCTACSKGNYVCSYLPPTQAQWQTSSPRPSLYADKVTKPTTRKRNPQSSQAKIDARLARLEELLLQVQPAIRAQGNIVNSRHGSESGGSDRGDTLTDSRNGTNTSRGPASASTTSAGQIPIPLIEKQGNYTSKDDTLLVQGGHTHFVSAQHWALLAEEVSPTYSSIHAMKNSFLNLSISFKISRNCLMQRSCKMRNPHLNHKIPLLLPRDHLYSDKGPL
jgi:hypothetical protein